MSQPISGYVEAGSQLVAELYVNDIKRSTEFYRSFGFELARDDDKFVELRWDNSLLFLEEVAGAPGPEHQVGNIRIMVPNVDHYWELAGRLGARVTRPIADRYYGLRDFTVAGPDGLSLRFASTLADSSAV